MSGSGAFHEKRDSQGGSSKKIDKIGNGRRIRR
jgi:hypothetical protein